MIRLDCAIGGLVGGGSASSQMGSALVNLLKGGGQQGDSRQSGGPGGMTGGVGRGPGGGMTGGGLGGPVSSFEQDGLGHTAQSWVGMDRTRRSRPISWEPSLGRTSHRTWRDRPAWSRTTYCRSSANTFRMPCTA